MNAFPLILLLALFSLACGGGGGGATSSETYVPALTSVTFAENTTIEQASITSFKPLNSQEWGETAVRKVLHAFAYGSAASDAQVDINHANAQLLADSLHGVGLKKAQAIVAWRDANGEFSSADQLVEVKGIGENLLAKNKERIVLE